MRHILRRGEAHLDFIDLLRNRSESLHNLLIMVYLQWIYMGGGAGGSKGFKELSK
jgi:hypothetical protein